MNDRDLLELAAKAAGYGLPIYLTDGLPAWEGTAGKEFISDEGLMVFDDIHDCWRRFNPINSDGDALRLFTCLPFRELYVYEIGVTVLWKRDGRHVLKCVEFASEHKGDLKAATRRAIVRAAAEIGRNMT